MAGTRSSAITSILWISLLAPFAAGPAGAQTCFNYVDGCLTLPPEICVNAKVPIECKQQGDLTEDCDWDPNCFDDGDAADCCTSIPAAAPQTLLEMHTRWHECFGNDRRRHVPPAGRGQRWYAFHRQFEYDFNVWRRANGFDPIESLEWCPDMNLPPPGSLANHPVACGSATRGRRDRLHLLPASAVCLFHNGGGPTLRRGRPPVALYLDTRAADNVWTAPSRRATCGQAGSASASRYDSLDEFANVDEVAKILDDQFHGRCTAPWVADRYTRPRPRRLPPLQRRLQPSDCSPRDPMFWRLHKALDDVVRAWQDAKAVDVVLVIDRSGSMAEPDAGGGTKFAAALEAVDNFAACWRTAERRPSGGDNAANRIGIVSYSELGVDRPAADRRSTRTCATPAGAVPRMRSTTSPRPGPAAARASGAASRRRSSCSARPATAGLLGRRRQRPQGHPAADRRRREPSPLPAAGRCGRRPAAAPSASAPQLDYDKLEFTQVVAVGFGNAGSLNGEPPDPPGRAPGRHLHARTPTLPGQTTSSTSSRKAFGQLTDEFLLIDPRGLLTVDRRDPEPVEYTACGDDELTFASGWQTAGRRRASCACWSTRRPATSCARRPRSGVETSPSAWEFAASTCRTAARTRAPGGRSSCGRTASTSTASRPTRFVDRGRGGGRDAGAAPDPAPLPRGLRAGPLLRGGRLRPRSVYGAALERESSRRAPRRGQTRPPADAAAFTTALGATAGTSSSTRAWAPTGAEPYDPLLATRALRRASARS